MEYHEMYQSLRQARMLLSHLTEPGDTVIGKFVQLYGVPTTLALLFDEDKYAVDPELAAARKRTIPRLPRVSMTELQGQYQDKGITVVMPGDEDWPSGLDDLGEKAPWCLYMRGRIGTLRDLDEGLSVSIVGARAATSYGEHVAMELAGVLASAGWPIVSGAAYGIDGAAHRAALAHGTPTIAFVAGGVDRPYPMGHAQLIARIVETGAMLSEVPPGSAPTKWRFLERNRLIAAATPATVVVEAGWRSGSLNTAGHAQALGRKLGAVPGPITSAASAGCHRLLREYGATCITSADDIVQMVGVPQEVR